MPGDGVELPPAGAQALAARVRDGKDAVRSAALQYVDTRSHRLAMFIVTLTYLKPVDAIDALMADHVAWLEQHYASGLFIASGRRVPRTGGVILARSGNAQALQDAIAADPFTLHGAARADIVEFTPSMTAPGAEVLKTL